MAMTVGHLGSESFSINKINKTYYKKIRIEDELYKYFMKTIKS